MTFDQYSVCGFSCFYCFSQYQRAVGRPRDDYIAGNVHAVRVDRVKRIFTEPDSSQFGDWVKARRAMQWGGLSDPFCPFEKKLGVGLELLRFFHEIDYPISFSTKGTWWLNDKRYSELFAQHKNWPVKFSIITTDHNLARAMEVGVPTPTARLKAMAKFVALGGGEAVLRMRPYIIGATDKTVHDLIRRAAEAGASAVTTEMYCYEGRSAAGQVQAARMNALLGYDINKFYKRYSYGSGYMRLNRNVKREYFKEAQEIAHSCGLRFYVSDAHFKELCDGACCCGHDEGFPYGRGQFTNALLICKREGAVRWSDIADDLAYADKFLWRNADGYNSASAEKRAKFWDFTMYDYLRWLWNNPKAANGPYRYFEGVMRPRPERDEQGDIVYEYDETRT